MTALIAIPLCAILYRARGAGWPRQWWGLDDRGIVKAVCLFILASAMALPIAMADPTWLPILAAGVALGAAFWTGRAGHGEFYHDGMQAPPRPRHGNKWIGWVPGMVGAGASVWRDRIGLGLTGLLFTGPAAIAALIVGQWPYAIALIAAGLIGKPLAYAIGWRALFDGPSEFRQTGAGEWLFGAAIGAAVAIGVIL